MDRFAFVMVLFSIIVGLGITELLTNVARQIRLRSKTKFSLLYTSVVAILFVALVQQWWEAWALQSVSS